MGTPVAFMTHSLGVDGGNDVDAPRVGDTVRVFGKDYESAGGLYGGVYWKPDAYHALQSEFSIYVERGGRLEVIADEKHPNNERADLDNLRAALAGLPLPHPTTTIPPVTTTTSAGS